MVFLRLGEQRKRILWILGFICASCSHAPFVKKPIDPLNSPQLSQEASSETLENPPLNSIGPVPGHESKAFGPEAPLRKSVVLVVGPGARQGWALAGVLKALSELKISVDAAYASELAGALIALEGLSQSIDEFDWKLSQLKEDLFEKKGDLLKSFQKESLRKNLEKLYESKSMIQSKFSMTFFLQKHLGEEFFLTSSNQPMSKIAACLLADEFMDPCEWNIDGHLESVASSSQGFDQLLQKAVLDKRHQGWGPIIWIGLNQELKIHGDCDLILNLPIQKGTHDQKNDLIFLARKMVLAHRQKFLNFFKQP